MLIYGVFVKYKWRDEKTGRSTFLLNAADGSFLFCHGTFQPMSGRIPLKLEGEYTGSSDFEVKKAFFCGYNKEVVKNFLLRTEFKKFGKIDIEKLLTETGTDIFEYVREANNIEASLNELKYNTDATRHLLLTLKEKTDIEAVLTHIFELGGSYHNALKLYKKLKSNIVKQTEDNPYLMLEADVPLKTIEKYAYKLKIKPYDPRRTAAIVSSVVYHSRKNGNTRIAFHDLVKKIHRNEALAGFYKTENIFIAEVLTSNRYKVVEEDNDFYVYTSDDYKTECEISANLFRLKKAGSLQEFKEEFIAEAEKECNIHYSKEQIRAFDLLKTSGVKIVTGGPGTGKTTFLNGCITIYKKMYPYASIILCAPTGCAAARMHDSTGMPALTIHKLLDIKQGNCDEVVNKLGADFIIVDETSMVPANIFNALLQATKNGATLLLLGDKDQLPSIGAGDVLNNLIESNEIETYFLNTIFRQEAGNLIVKNARSIIQGDTGLETDKKFRIKRYQNEELLLDDLNSICSKLKSDYTVFTAAKKLKYRSGTINLNRMIHKSKNPEGGIIYGYYSFNDGDRVLFTQNNYDKGYYNGEIGTITNIQKINESIKISVMAEGDMIYLRDNEINDLELAYAMTAHKAQGSECENAIIVIAKEPRNMLQRKLLYVELTRAKKAVLILSEDDALEDCIKNDYSARRNCGLCRKIQATFGDDFI